ncbi:malate dehydrogenase [Thermosynechococcaceae cyanobacterium Okahandja]
MSSRVAVLGAGNVGSALAQRLVEGNIADVVLLDVIDGRPQGLALDLTQSRLLQGHDRQLLGTTNYDDIAGVDVVVITAGFPRKPGMSRDDLLKLNGNLIQEITRQAVAVAPEAVYIVVTNPLDVMTHVAWQVSGLPPQRVMGMAGVLDAARFAAFIALELNISVKDIRAMVLGGHGDLMVPLPRYSSVSGIPITELLPPNTIERLIHRTRHGGAEIVNLLQTGSAFYTPAAAAALMVEAILANHARLLPVCAYVQQAYHLREMYVGVPARIDRQGVAQVIELPLTEAELQALHASAQAVQKVIATTRNLLA